MIERTELSNLNRGEPIREVGQPRENSLEKTDKPFVAELKDRIGERKKRDKKKKDEIILRAEETSEEKDENDQDKEDEQIPTPSPDGQKGNKIDLLA